MLGTTMSISPIACVNLSHLHQLLPDNKTFVLYLSGHHTVGSLPWSEAKPGKHRSFVIRHVLQTCRRTSTPQQSFASARELIYFITALRSLTSCTSYLRLLPFILKPAVLFSDSSPTFSHRAALASNTATPAQLLHSCHRQQPLRVFAILQLVK